MFNDLAEPVGRAGDNFRRGVHFLPPFRALHTDHPGAGRGKPLDHPKKWADLRYRPAGDMGKGLRRWQQRLVLDPAGRGW